MADTLAEEREMWQQVWFLGSAAVLAAVAVASCISLIIFFVVGGPFGSINDVGNGTLAVLCGVLAFALYTPRRTAATTVAVAVAVAGAATSVLGSFLVISDTTGYLLAGLVSAFGFALIGLWLVHLSRSEALPTARSAFTAGAVMAIGIVNVPGILQGMDDQDTAPTWFLAADGVCWAGTYLLWPMWATRFARSGLAPAEPA